MIKRTVSLLILLLCNACFVFAQKELKIIHVGEADNNFPGIILRDTVVKQNGNISNQHNAICYRLKGFLFIDERSFIKIKNIFTKYPPPKTRYYYEDSWQPGSFVFLLSDLKDYSFDFCYSTIGPTVSMQYLRYIKSIIKDSIGDCLFTSSISNAINYAVWCEDSIAGGATHIGEHGHKPEVYRQLYLTTNKEVDSTYLHNRLKQYSNIESIFVYSDKFNYWPKEAYELSKLKNITIFSNNNTCYNGLEMFKGVEKITLADSAIVSFPENLFKIKKLKNLNLIAPDLKYVALNINKLNEGLTTLDLRCERLQTLPDKCFLFKDLYKANIRIGSFQKNAHIDFSFSHNLVSLSIATDSIIDWNSFFIHTDKATLEELRIYNKFHQNIPAVFSTFSTLLHLQVRVDSLAYITEDIDKLKNLVDFIVICNHYSDEDAKRIRHYFGSTVNVIFLNEEFLDVSKVTMN